jgi:hypothetical protein
MNSFTPATATAGADREGADDPRMEALIARLPHRLQAMMQWLRRPSSRWARLPAGVLLILGGVFSILPFLGLWMLPLGLILLAEDSATLRRPRDRLLGWIERRWPAVTATPPSSSKPPL